MPEQTELVVVEIDDVDMNFRRALATSNQGPMNVYFREYPGGMLLIPKQGEWWLVARRGWDWYLEKKLDNDEEHQNMLNQMGQGDMRFKAAGTILAESQAMYLNGRAWGASIRDTFHAETGFEEITLSHSAISTDTINPTLNGVLVPEAQWTYNSDTRTISFLEELGEIGWLIVDYQTWMTNNDDVGTISGRSVIRAIEEFEDN